MNIFTNFEKDEHDPFLRESGKEVKLKACFLTLVPLRGVENRPPSGFLHFARRTSPTTHNETLQGL